MDDGEAPRFIVGLESMNFMLESDIELECKVTGKPQPSIKWYVTVERRQTFYL